MSLIGHVYFIRPVGEEGPVKIGWSRAPAQRARTISSWSWLDLDVATTLPGSMSLEGKFHRKFREQHLRREWFSASPDLSETIRRVQAGTFDVSTLPDGRGFRHHEWPEIRRRDLSIGQRIWRLSSARLLPADVRADYMTYCGTPMRERDPAHREKLEKYLRDEYPRLMRAA